MERMKLDISNLERKLNVKSTTMYMSKFHNMGVCSGSRDLLKIWEISANISETVRDRYVVTMKD